MITKQCLFDTSVTARKQWIQKWLAQFALLRFSVFLQYTFSSTLRVYSGCTETLPMLTVLSYSEVNICFLVHRMLIQAVTHAESVKWFRKYTQGTKYTKTITRECTWCSLQHVPVLRDTHKCTRHTPLLRGWRKQHLCSAHIPLFVILSLSSSNGFPPFPRYLGVPLPRSLPPFHQDQGFTWVPFGWRRASGWQDDLYRCDQVKAHA